MKHIILMSVYNGGPYLEEQLNSIVNSSKNYDVTLVVYDDLSEDNSLNIIKSFEKKINIVFLKYINLKNVSRNFNHLLEYSLKRFGRNNIYYFCDQDDIWNDNKLNTTNNLFNSTNSSLLFSKVKHFGIENKILIPNINRFFLLDLIFNVAPGMSYAFIPSRFNKDLSFLKFFRWHDHGLFLLAKIFGPPPIVSNSILQYYRRHNNAYMKVNSIGFLNRFFYFLSNINALIKIILLGEKFLK